MKISVFPFGDNDHNQQVLAGFEILRRLGCLEIRYRYDGLSVFNMDHTSRTEYSALYQIVVMRLDGVGDVVFDLNDSDIVFENLHDACIVYFKRSFCRSAHARFPKIRPLGLNYEARPPFLSASALYRSIVLSKSAVSRVRGVLRVFGLPRPYTFSPNKDRQARISLPAPPRILFLARTWDPCEFDAQYHRHLDAINAMRADCVRELRRTFGDSFTGGLLASPHAKRHFPDCVTPATLRTDRRSFLRLVDTHQICVATSGLHDSTGWKFAEFVAKGRAIVAEAMRFQVPGPMSEGTNYLAFDSAASCVEKCAVLMRDAEYRYEMMSANRAYYNGYVTPEALVRNAISWACPTIERGLQPHPAKGREAGLPDAGPASLRFG